MHRSLERIHNVHEGDGDGLIRKEGEGRLPLPQHHAFEMAANTIIIIKRLEAKKKAPALQAVYSVMCDKKH